MVTDYWKRHVAEWIEEHADEVEHGDPDHKIPSSLAEVYEIMVEDEWVFYCEDCNDSSTGTRCQRNRDRSARCAEAERPSKRVKREAKRAR